MVTSICQVRLRVGKRQAPGREEEGFELGATGPQSPCFEPQCSTYSLAVASSSRDRGPAAAVRSVRHYLVLSLRTGKAGGRGSPGLLV